MTSTSPRQALNRLHESQAVRRVADCWLNDADLSLSPAGRRRLYAELASAFRQWEQRAALDNSETQPAVAAAGLNLPALYSDFKSLLNEKGYYTRYELPSLAAQALALHWPPGDEPAVIYYLPRHPTASELELMEALLGRGKCRVIIGMTGDADADGPALDLYRRLANQDAPVGVVAPLERAVAAGALSVTIAPDPVEEVRTVVRRIVAVSDRVPFHRIAVIHRQESPYASLLRQELDFADIPSSGVPRRTLADTGAGRFLLGVLALIRSMDGDADADPAIDREQFIELIMSCPVRFPPSSGDRRRPSVEVPATQWANLAREARANGTVGEWTARLTAHVRQQIRRVRELSGEAPPDGQAAGITGRLDADGLVSFIDRLAPRLMEVRRPADLELAWRRRRSGSNRCLTITSGAPTATMRTDRRIEEILDGLAGLADWDIEYDAEVLQETVGDELQRPVSHRGNPVGAGVYVGPPAGIVGAQYDAIFAVGMAEGQFPPTHRPSIVDEWRDSGATAQTRRALERYEFLGAVASADRAALSYPVAGAGRRMAYPSPWLLEAANLLHEANGGAGRLNAENLVADAGGKPWLTVIPSREMGLRGLASPTGDAPGDAIAPADLADYNLMRLLAHGGGPLASHPAWATDSRVLNALRAREARLGATLTEWDGRVGSGSRRVSEIGVPGRPVSPSALETWATCPYRYFLHRVLRISPPPVADAEGEISALDRGVLVHRILEEFVNREMQSEDELLELANAEFAAAQRTGITGYPLLWEIEREAIRAGLRSFFAADADWLGGPPLESRSEQSFDDVGMDIPGLGVVHFRGKIDRLDVLADEVRVRDFKTGSPNRYTSGPTTQNAYTVANGRALQLPVYVAAARQMYPDVHIRASYCFPLSDNPAREGRPYTDADGLAEFHGTLRNILGTARSGVFPATPEEGDRGNCRYCDFNRLCPARRRQIWERKGRNDPAVQAFNALGGRAAIETDE